MFFVQKAKYYSKPIVSSRNYSHAQQDSKSDNKFKKQESFVSTIKCFKCGKKARSCRLVKCDEKQGKNTRELSNQTEEKQLNGKQEVDSETEEQQGNIKQHFEELRIRMLSMSKSSTCGDAVIVGVYKIDISVGGVPSRALADSGSQVCIVRKQLLPYIKKNKEWGLRDCLQQQLPFDAQPVGAEGFGALALVKLEITIAATDKCLEIPCYVMIPPNQFGKEKQKIVE